MTLTRVDITCWPPASLQDLGNEAFTRGDLSSAESLYTQSLALDPGSSTAWANRALVRLRGGDAAGAEADATEALKRDMGNVKALHRRGMARRALGRLQEAAIDLQQVAGKLPGDAGLQEDLRVTMAALREHPSNAPAATHATR